MGVKRRTILGTAAGAVTLAGCLVSDDSNDGSAAGSDDETETNDDDSGDGYGTSDEPEQSDGDAAEPTVQVGSSDDYGAILVGPDGRTLYVFDPDPQGSDESACYDDCAENWPPLTVEDEPNADADVTAEVTTFEREDGARQVAVDGWPLYYFAGDEEPGDVDGQGRNDVWWVLRPDGTPVTSDADEDHGHSVEAIESPSDSADVAMVSADEHHFDPHLVWIEPGSTVTWTLESGSHTTTAYGSDAEKPRRIPDDADGWDSDIVQEVGGTFEHTFDVEGVYDYFCRPHEGMGMVGSVIVGEPDPSEQPALEAPQEDLPEGAREGLERLNRATNETLGYTDE